MNVLALSLSNSLVVGAALCTAAFVATRIGLTSARARFAAWFAALMLMLAVPPALLTLPPIIITAGGAATAPSIAQFILPAWMIIAGARLVSVVVACARLRPLYRHSIADERLQSLVDSARAILRCRRAIDVGYSTRVPIPMLIGFTPAAIRVPLSLRSMSDDELTAVLLHEVAHANRGDDWLRLAEMIAGALLFFHPGAIYARRRLAFERELACDEAASAHCGLERYVQSIVEIAHCHATNAVPIVLAANGARLVERVKALVAPQRRSRTFMASIAAISILAACTPLVQRPVLARIDRSAAIAAPDMESEGAEHYGRAFSLFSAGQYSESIDEYQKAIALGYEVESSQYNIESARTLARRSMR